MIFRWTEQEYQKVLTRHGVRDGVDVDTRGQTETERRLSYPQGEVQLASGFGRATIKHGSNPAPSPFAPYASKWEQNYAIYLNLQLNAGEIKCWRYGRVTFRLAKGQYHRIDFIVLRNDGRVQMDQIKGWHPNLRAAIKGLKWAAQLWPMFYWTITKWNGSGWETVEIEV